MYIIERNSAYSRITPDLEKDVFKLVDEVTRFRPPGYFRMPSFKAGQWDGYRHLFSQIKQRFPSGLIHRVLYVFDKNNIPYKIKDERICPSPGVPEDFVYDWQLEGDWEPRYYQDEAIAAAIQAGTGVIWIGTGGGKTSIAAAIWKGLGGPKGAVFVHRKTLLKQLATEFIKRLPDDVHVGMIGDGIWDLGDVTICIINSVFPPTTENQKKNKKRQEKWKKTLDWLHSLKFIYSDECHLVSNNLWWKILMETKEAYYRFAGSGTPFYRDDSSQHLLVAATGPLIYKKPYEELKKEGYVCGTRLYIVPFGDGPEYKQYANLEWKVAYPSLVVYNTARHNIILNALERFRNGRMALVLCISLDHGSNLEAVLRDAGLNTVFISGATGTIEREDVVKDLEKGRIDVLIASSIFDTGIDIPGISLIINAGAGKARSKAIQKIGRGVRNTEGKEDLVYVDIQDLGNKTLREHSLNRLKAYKSEGGYQISILEVSELTQGADQ